MDFRQSSPFVWAISLLELDGTSKLEKEGKTPQKVFRNSGGSAVQDNRFPSVVVVEHTLRSVGSHVPLYHKQSTGANLASQDYSAG